MKWSDIRTARRLVTERIEPLRRDKTVGSSLEADVILTLRDPQALEWCRSVDMAEICITSSCQLASGSEDAVQVLRSTNSKCGRCWRLLPEVPEDGALCNRCDEAVAQLDAVS